MGLAMLLGMIVISIIFFRDLGLKRILSFNAVFFGAALLPLIGIPDFVAFAVQAATIIAYFSVAKTV